MSEEAAVWAWEQEVGGVEKLVLVAVAQGATSRGVCFETQADLATKTGVDPTTVRRNLKRLAEKELLHREARYSVTDGGREADAIVLHTPRAERPVSPRAQDPVSPRAERPASVREQEVLPTEEGGNAREAVPPDLLRDVNDLLRQKRKVGSKQVSEQEMMIAARAVAEFNRQLGSDYGLGAHLTAIVGRIRDRPSWDAAKHERLVQSAFRVRWWEKSGSGRRPTPNVIYSERSFESVVQDAADEAAGRTAEIRKRRGREV